jgi:hypothetical protein
MKPLSVLFLIGFITLAAPLKADTLPPDNGNWFMQVNGDYGFPTGNLAGAVNQGWGGELSFGFRSNQHFSLSLESGFDSYAGKSSALNAAWNIMPLVVKFQHGIGLPLIRPYYFLAAGLALNSKLENYFSFTASNNEVDFLGEAGLGLAFPLVEKFDRADFFIQTKVEIDTTSAGYSGDQPTVLIPINAGLKFALD